MHRSIKPYFVKINVISRILIWRQFTKYTGSNYMTNIDFYVLLSDLDQYLYRVLKHYSRYSILMHILYPSPPCLAYYTRNLLITNQLNAWCNKNCCLARRPRILHTWLFQGRLSRILTQRVTDFQMSGFFFTPCFINFVLKNLNNFCAAFFLFCIFFLYLE